MDHATQICVTATHLTTQGTHGKCLGLGGNAKRPWKTAALEATAHASCNRNSAPARQATRQRQQHGASARLQSRVIIAAGVRSRPLSSYYTLQGLRRSPRGLEDARRAHGGGTRGARGSESERVREDTACFTVCVSSAECGTGVVTQVTATVPSKVAHRTTA